MSEIETLRRELLDLKIKCGMCICGEVSTDECCPQCIPGNHFDLFDRYVAALKLIEKVRAVGNSSAFVSVFQCAANHHAGYQGETWQAELETYDRVHGRPIVPRVSTTSGTMAGDRVLLSTCDTTATGVTGVAPH